MMHKLYTGVRTSLIGLYRAFALPVTGGRPAVMDETTTDKATTAKPLTLDLQFFAAGEPGDPDNEPDDNKGEPGGNGEVGDGGDPDNDDDISLKELLKQNKKLKQEYGEKFNQDFQKRLKGLNLEEARKAVELLDKLGLKSDGSEKDDGGEGDNNKPPAAVEQKAAKLEEKMKVLSLKVYAADNGLDSELISALAASRLQSLDLNDDDELEKDDLEEIVDELRERFPRVFPTKDDDTQKPDDKRSASFGPAGRERFPSKPKPKDPAEAAKERYERLKKKKAK